MTVKEVGEDIYLIDAETAGIKGFIASYVLRGKKVAMVETGPASSVPNLLNGLKELSIKPESVAYVAVSHIHLDHGGGVGTLLKKLPNAKVIVHPRGAPHLAHPEKLWEQSKLVLGSITDLYGAPEPVPENRILAPSDGESFDLGNDLRLMVVETLGHASHHQSYCEDLTKSIFLGDAAGIYLNEINVIVPTTPAPFRMDIALASLDKLIRMKPSNLLYSHFGKATDAMRNLKVYEKQLKLWATIARRALDNHESLEAIREEIVSQDAHVQKALNYIKLHPVLGETVLSNSVEGIVDYVKNFKN